MNLSLSTVLNSIVNCRLCGFPRGLGADAKYRSRLRRCSCAAYAREFAIVCFTTIATAVNTKTNQRSLATLSSLSVFTWQYGRCTDATRRDIGWDTLVNIVYAWMRIVFMQLWFHLLHTSFAISLQ